MILKKSKNLLLRSLALLALCAAAQAQVFPSKPVRIVVPFPPGVGADTLARIMGSRETGAPRPDVFPGMNLAAGR